MNKSKLFEKLTEMKEIMGTEHVLDEIFNGLSSDELYDVLEYIDRMHDLNLFED